MRNRFVHRLGLTDAILARTDAKPDRPAHKYSLRRRADELAQLLDAADVIDAGVYRRSVEAGEAPPWIVGGLGSVEATARKIYTRHRLVENLTLALTFPERIRIPDWREEEALEGEFSLRCAQLSR